MELYREQYSSIVMKEKFRLDGSRSYLWYSPMTTNWFSFNSTSTSNDVWYFSEEIPCLEIYMEVARRRPIHWGGAAICLNFFEVRQQLPNIWNCFFWTVVCSSWFIPVLQVNRSHQPKICQSMSYIGKNNIIKFRRMERCSHVQCDVTGFQTSRDDCNPVWPTLRTCAVLDIQLDS
jgi:hypothetical protein